MVQDDSRSGEGSGSEDEESGLSDSEEDEEVGLRRVPRASNPGVAPESAGLGRVPQVASTQVPTSARRGGSQAGTTLGGLGGAKPSQFEGNKGAMRPGKSTGGGIGSIHSALPDQPSGSRVAQPRLSDDHVAPPATSKERENRPPNPLPNPTSRPKKRTHR